MLSYLQSRGLFFFSWKGQEFLNLGLVTFWSPDGGHNVEIYGSLSVLYLNNTTNDVKFLKFLNLIGCSCKIDSIVTSITDLLFNL